VLVDQPVESSVRLTGAVNAPRINDPDIPEEERPAEYDDRRQCEEPEGETEDETPPCSNACCPLRIGLGKQFRVSFPGMSRGGPSANPFQTAKGGHSNRLVHAVNPNPQPAFRPGRPHAGRRLGPGILRLTGNARVWYVSKPEVAAVGAKSDSPCTWRGG
jgi:hypothetical protein